MPRKKRLRIAPSSLAAAKSGSPRRLSKATQGETVRIPLFERMARTRKKKHAQRRKKHG